MGRRKQNDGVAQLVKLGYSVTRARKALKECGGNVSNARYFLQQQEATEVGQSASTIQGNNVAATNIAAHPAQRSRDEECEMVAEEEANAAVRENTRRDGAEASLCSDGAVPTTRSAVRVHPCVVQHGSCRYGDRCYLRDMPGDICIHYYQGPCIYGDECLYRHSVDGRDIATWKKNTTAATIDLNGERYVIAEQLQGRVAVAKRLPIAEVAPETITAQTWQATATTPASSQGPHALSLHPRSGNASSSSSDLVVGDDEEYDDEAIVRGALLTRFAHATQLTAPPLPTPYLDILRRDQPDVVAAQDEDGNNSRGDTMRRTHEARQLRRVQHLLPRRTPPPASVPARVTDRGEAQDRVGHVGSPECEPHVSATRTRKKHPCLTQYGSCKYGDACRHAQRDADICVHFLNGHCRYSAAECPYRHTRDNEDSNNSSESSEAMSGADVGRAPCETNSQCTSDSAEDEMDFDQFYHDATSPTTTTVVAASETECSDAELAKLLRVVELFPDEEPATLLLALRGCGGVIESVPDLMERLQRFDEVDSDEALARLLAEEESVEQDTRSSSASNAATSQPSDRTQALLLLCELFEECEPNAIAGILTQCQDNVVDAYEQLLFARERIARSDYPVPINGAWRDSAKLLDEAHLERLCNLYRPMDRQTVRMVYEMLEQDSTKARCVLDEMLAAELAATQTPSAGPRARRKTALPRATAPPCRGVQLVRAAAKTPRVTSPEANSIVDDYRAIEAEVQAHEDWRRVRAEAYMLNSCRLRVVQRATQAFLAGKGDVAKQLSREGRELEREYRRLNRLAMLALELERRKQSPVSTLDLHGFHVDEVREVLLRRVRECVRRRITRLTVVFGKGLHSKRAGPQIGPTVVDLMRHDAELKELASVVSFKQAYLELRIRLS